MKKLSEVINYLIKEDIDSEGNLISNTNKPIQKTYKNTTGVSLFYDEINYITSNFIDETQNSRGNNLFTSLRERIVLINNFSIYKSFNKAYPNLHTPNNYNILKINKEYYQIKFNNKEYTKSNKQLNEDLMSILINTDTFTLFNLKILNYMFFTQYENVNNIKSDVNQLKTYNFIKNIITGNLEYFKELNNDNYFKSLINFYNGNTFSNQEYTAIRISFILDLINFTFLCFNDYNRYAKSENFIKHLGYYQNLTIEASDNLHNNFENLMWKNDNSFLNCIKDDIKNKKDIILLLNFVDVSNLNFENLTYNVIDNLNQINNTEKTKQNQTSQQNSSNIQDNDKVAVIWYSTDNKYNDSNFDKNHTWKSIQDFYKNSEFYSKYLDMKKEFRNIAGQNMWVISFHRKNNQIPSYKDKPKKDSKPKQTNVSHTEEPLV